LLHKDEHLHRGIIIFKPDELEYLIKTCLNIELNDEAYEYSKTLLVHNCHRLNEEERNLFMKAAKAKFNHYRNALKVLLDYEQQDDVESYAIPKELIKNQINLLEGYINNFCMNMDYNIDLLIKHADKEDIFSTIFYKKLKADYLRYYAEVASEDVFTTIVEKCEDIYKEVYNICADLEPHNPLALSVSLNYSIFIYFILDDTYRAYELADKSYKSAMAKLNPDLRNAEIDNIIRNLEENLTIWKIELFDVN
jgi:14-3-3 protein epsilon